MLDRIVLKKEAVEITGLSKSSLERLEKSADFPQRVQLSPRRVGYRLSALLDWLDSRPVAESTSSNISRGECNTVIGGVIIK